MNPSQRRNHEQRVATFLLKRNSPDDPPTVDLPAVESVTAQLKLVTPADEPLYVDIDLTDDLLVKLLTGMAARERRQLEEDVQRPADPETEKAWLERQRTALHRRERANLLEIAAHYVRRAKEALG